MNTIILKVINAISRFLPPKEQAVIAAASVVADEVSKAKEEKRKAKEAKKARKANVQTP